ncbi:MAG TPA: DEAD/DEAH box helicase [Saprospiraceae bacterium]|nr:DEAD/DEAH box helicase [Saprospiraceae bacterium]
MSFKQLSLIEPLMRALATEGYERPTPIQEQSIPIILQRRDLLGCAQTGTGKTAAFALPILQLLHGKIPANHKAIRCLILTPTRELAIQIDESVKAYGRHTGIRHMVVFGGVSQFAQTESLKRGCDILTATPGRLLDLMNQGYVSLRDVEIFVLDEADRMLDMGFIHDVKKVISKLPVKRQTLFFSATMPPEISNLANSILTDPLRVEVTPVSSTAEKVAQALYFVDKADKKHLLKHLLKDSAVRSVLVFTRTKHGANKVAADLEKAGVQAEAIHGNKSQNARQAALANFKSGKIRVLVATDIAARGIDIEELSHVINYELPNVPETYVHRIGRTGRAGASGIALSFCEAEEIPYLKDIQKLTGQLIPVEVEHPYAADLVAPGIPVPRSKEKPAAKPAVQKVPAPQRPDVIPIPERRPDTQRQGAQHRTNKPKPSEQPERRDRPNERPAGQERNNGGSSFNSGQKRDERRPDRNDRRDRPFRSEQKPAAKQNQDASDTPFSRGSRFASILEVASIEKQDRPKKPFADRDDRNRAPKSNDSRPPFGGDRKKKKW